MLQARRMGRKQAGENFRMLRNRKNIVKRTKKLKKKKRQAKKEKKQGKVYEGLPTITQAKGGTRVKKKKRKETKNAANNNTGEEPLIVNMKFPALSRSLK